MGGLINLFKFCFMRKIYSLLLFILFVNVANAQLTGTKTIPGDYATVTAAVSALNTDGVGTGGVTFNIAAGYTESITTSITLTATGTSANPIIFQKSGSGANPKITRTDAGTNTTTAIGALGDPIFQLSGSDYVTISGLDLASTSSTIEYGYSLFKSSGTNGCKNITIKNCAVTMTKGTSGYVIGINIGNGSTSLSSATGVTVTSSDGINENIQITGNSISNVHTPIYCRGSSATGFSDSDITIGGVDELGNTLVNFGGGSATTTYGVYFIYVKNPTVKNNTINQYGGGGSAHTSTLYGVFFSSGVTGTLICSGNTIALANASAASSTNYIYSANTVTSEEYDSNVFSAGTNTSTGTVNLVFASNNTNTKSITNNRTSGSLVRPSGTFYCYYNLGIPTGGSEIISNNTFSNIQNTGSSSTSNGTYGIYTWTSLSQSRIVSGNVMSDWSSTSTGTIYGIFARESSSCQVNNNSITNITGGGTIVGLFVYQGTTATVYENTISNISSSGVTVVGGYLASVSDNSFYKNIIRQINSNNSAPTVIGVEIGTGASSSYYNNFIGPVSCGSANLNTPLFGVYISSTTSSQTINFAHNSIYLNASSTGTNFGSSAIYANTSPTLNLINNIFVNTSTPSGTGITSVFRLSSTTLTTYGSSSNNNSFYAGTPSANRLIFYDGTNADQTLADYQARVSTRDAASISQNPTFVNTSGASANLHLSTSAGDNWCFDATGTPVTSITSDFDGDPRNSSNPDLGADEFAATGFVVTNPASVCPSVAVDLTSSAITAGSISGITFTYYTNASATSVLANPTAVTTPGTYYIKATSGSCSLIKPVVITNNPLPTPSVSGSNSICANSTGNVYSVTNVTGNTYAWNVTGGTVTAGAGTNSITVTWGAAGTGTVEVLETITATSCTQTNSLSVTINPNPTPSITGSTAVCTTNQGYVYSVASVAGNTYAWTVTGGTVTAGAGTNSITVTWGAVGTGSVAVTQTVTATGCATTATASINIQVLPTASETIVQPVTCASEDGQINLTLGGAVGPYTFAWTGTGQGITATAQNQSAVSAGFYNYTVTAANGCTVSATNVVVNGPGGCFICPTIGSIAATNTIICQNTNNTISVSGLADLGITYGIRFKYSMTPLTNPYLSTVGTVMSTVTNANLTGSGTGASTTYSFPTAGTVYVYAILSPTSPDPACRPYLVKSFVVAATPALTDPTDQVLCTGSTTSAVSLVATPSATTSFAWTNSRTSIGLAASGTGNIAAFTATNYTNAPVTATVVVTPTNTESAGGTTVACVGPTQSYTYTVNPIPTVNTVADQNVCAGTAVTLPFSGFVAGTVFEWTNSNTAIGLAASGTGNLSYTATNTTSAPITSTVVVTPKFTNPSGVTANTAPGGVEWCVIYDYDAANGRYRVGIDSREFIGTGVTPSTVNRLKLFDLWDGPVTYNSYDPNGWAEYWVYTTTQFNYAGSAYAANLRSANGFYGVSAEFTFANPGVTCTGNPISFTITVNPTPTVAAVTNQVLCNGAATTAVAFTGATTGTVYNWTNSNTSIGLAASGTGDIASFTAVNTGATAATATITVTPTYTGAGFTCTGTATTFTLTVNPTPRLTTVSNSIICNGSSNTIALTGPVTGSVYSWTNDNTAIGLGASGTGNISFTATNAGPDPITGTVSVTPSYTNAGLTCTGTASAFTVTVNPNGQVNTVSNQVLCNGSTTSAVTFSTTNNGLISTGGTQTASSGTISVSVPDASAAGATHTIPVNLPTGAVINNMRVTMNMTHTWISDMVINLKAPNGQILNLFNQHGGSGDNLVNTVVSSTGTTAFSSGSAPFTGTFAATAASGQGPTGNVSNAANFAALYSTPNGNWVLAMRDLFGGDLGVLTSWSISIDYTVQGTFGTNMNWTNSTTSIGLGASGTGNIPSFTAVNNGSAPVTSTVTVTPVYFNGGVSCAGTPTTFTYTVNPTPTVNAVVSPVFCAGTPSTVNFSGNATGTVYSWTNSNTDIGLAASGTGSLSFTPTNTGTTPIIATITVTPSFTNGGVTCTGTPRTFTITVNPVGQANAVTSQVLCNGSNTTAVSFATVNGGGTIVAGTPVVSNSGTISILVPDANAGGASHTIPVTLPAGATVTGVSVNFNMNHTWVSDMVFNLKAPNGQILNLVNRRGGAGVNFTNTTISSAGTASLATGAAPFTGTFAADAAIGVGPTGQLSSAANYAALYAVGSGDWTLQMRDYVGGDVGTLTSWSITINYTTLVPAVTSYAWTNNLSSIGLAASGTGNIASFAATNTTAAPVTATVTVTPTYTNAGVGCAGTPISYTYTVNPTPTVNAVSNQTVCVGSNVAAVNYTGATTGTVYNWTNSNTAIGLAASGTGNIASFVGTNTTAAPISGTITVTPVYTNAGVTCTGTPRTFTITVNPIPTVNAVANFAACHNTTAAAAFSGATTGTVFNWTNSNPAIGLPASGSGNISFTALNTTSAPVTATITVTPSFTNGGTTCVGTPTSFVITVNPLPVVTTGALPGRICISDTLVRLNGTPVGGSWSGFGISGFNFMPPATDVGAWPITYTYADANGCVNRATTNVTVLACEERDRDLDNGAVILYPNPNSGQFNLRVNSTRFNVLGMKVYNTAGQLVYANQWRGLVFARVIPVNLNNLAAGNYMVRLYYGDGMDRGADKTYQVIIAR